MYNYQPEIWAWVPGYEGLYRVSNKGRVYSKYNNMILTEGIFKGYKDKQLIKNKTRKTIRVHRLVALTFLPNPEGKRTVNHKDGNKENNNINNLEWATYSENRIHAIRTGLASAEMPKRNRACIGTDKNGIEYKYDSIKQAAQKTGCGKTGIVYCCQGKRKKTKGYEWRYANE